jgi:nicotinate phosphoribosyltransferase
MRAALDAGVRPAAVRIDSGDLLSLSRTVRAMLDASGVTSTRIIVSGDLDEWKIQELIRAHAPIDTFAVGTALTTSDDAPALGGVYKLVEIESGGTMRPVMKRSTGKATWPGRKQVWRAIERGVAAGDAIALETDPPARDALALLEPVMREGRRVARAATLDALRQHRAEMIGLMPHAFRELSTPVEYDVERSDSLTEALG